MGCGASKAVATLPAPAGTKETGAPASAPVRAESCSSPLPSCPGGCGYAVTWHKTHCCGRCASGGGGEHGQRCERRPAGSAATPVALEPSSGPTPYELDCRAAAPQFDGSTETLQLPLSIHLVHDGPYHLSVSDFVPEGVILRKVNQTWQQARITWNLKSVSEHTLDELPWLDVSQLQQGAVRALEELNSAVKPLYDPTTYQVFVHAVLPQHSSRPGAIQGFARGRGTESAIHLGAWSTKGYAHPTERAPELIARTLCHELGHALSLAHTSRRKWPDGTFMAGVHPRCFEATEAAQPFRNVMAGGNDKNGGAGGHLEPWQVTQARRCAQGA
jgi:hypothetical protein